MNISDLSSTQLRRAATVKARIESLQADLATILRADAGKDVSARPARKRWTMSPAARAKISAAATARWAKIKAAKKK